MANSDVTRRSAISVQDLLCHPTPETPTRLISPPPADAPYTTQNQGYVFTTSPFTLHASLKGTMQAAHVSQSTQRMPDRNVRSTAERPTSETTGNSDERDKATRGPWRAEEDRLLVTLVQRYGACQWSSIAKHLPRRTGKQARERWMNQLNPALKKKNWTIREDRIILHAHVTMGNKWSSIARLLHGRTDNSVKNRFNSTLKRAIRERAAGGGVVTVDDVVESLHSRPYCGDAAVDLSRGMFRAAGVATDVQDRELWTGLSSMSGANSGRHRIGSNSRGGRVFGGEDVGISEISSLSNMTRTVNERPLGERGIYVDDTVLWSSGAHSLSGARYSRHDGERGVSSPVVGLDVGATSASGEALSGRRRLARAT